MSPDPVSREAPPLRDRIVSTQTWRDLTFLHWAVDPALVAHLTIGAAAERFLASLRPLLD